MLEPINPTVVQRADDLAIEFARADPFRHVVIENFLEPAFCERLIGEFPAFDTGKALNEMGEVGRKASVPDIAAIGPAYRRFDSLMRDRSFLDYVGRITGIADLLYDPDYVGGGTHENLDGQELDPHVDFNYHPRRPLHRRLNLIVFLNPEWDESWGGCLELHKNAWNPKEDRLTRFVPLANRAVLFETTEDSWHGFTRITLPESRRELSRRSIAVYFYTRHRPQAETSCPHATVYVPRPLPLHLRAGHTLSEADVEAMETLIARRDAQLRFLYERERKFSQLIAGITGSLSFRIGRAVTWPARKLRNR